MATPEEVERRMEELLVELPENDEARVSVSRVLALGVGSLDADVLQLPRLL